MTGMKDARLTPLGDERAQQIKALLARLESAVGPDPSLGGDVLIACGWEYIPSHNILMCVDKWVSPSGKTVSPDDFSDPTSSIDAALTLVPEQMFVGLRRFSDGWYAAVALKSDLEDKGVWRGNQKPAPIAICIAALKARQSIAELAPQGAQPTHTKGDQ